MNGMGKAKYGKGGDFSKNFKLVTPKGSETSHNVYRILPPIKTQAETGKWAIFHAQHFGYNGRDKQDPTKTRFRTFRCVQDKDFRTGMIRVECAECSLIESKKLMVKDRTAQMEAANKDPEQIKTILTPLNDWLQKHNVSRKWHLNAMNEQGEFGVLEIGTKCKKALEERISQLLELGVDPLDPEQGVWFDFKRTGQKINVVDTVDWVSEATKVGGQIVSTMKSAPLSEEQCKRALEILPDLTQIGTVLGRDQIGMLVTGSGDPEEVDAIFNMGVKTEASPPVRRHSVGVEPKQTPSSLDIVLAKAETVVAVPAEEHPVDEVDEEAALMAQLAAARAAKAAAKAKAKPAPVAVVDTSVAVADTSDMSPEEFLSTYPQLNR